MSPAHRAALRVELGPRGYDIRIGSGLIGEAGPAMAPFLRQPRVAVITDRTVAERHLDPLIASLERAKIAHQAVILPPGEGSKDFHHLENLIETLLAGRIERKTALIALGGGVIGDLTGFAASILLRGIDFIQIPTTLLAQVDSSVGGKTGINSRHGKNLIGSFHQPRLVLADTEALASLPARQMRAGYAEVVKYGIIDRPDFFAWLEDNGAAVLAGEGEALRHAVLTSCAAKAEIVADDEREAGRRGLLNLGHTFGHAFEAECGYADSLLHGEAVAIGMVCALALSARLGLCPPAAPERLRDHLRALGLPTDLAGVAAADWTAQRLLAHMGGDKKVVDGKLTFVLAHGIGKAFMTTEVPSAQVLSLLDDLLEGRL